MKKSRSTEEQMVLILRETDRDTVAKRYGVSEQTIDTLEEELRCVPGERRSSAERTGAGEGAPEEAGGGATCGSRR